MHLLQSMDGWHCITKLWTNSSHTKHPCESMSYYVSPCIRELWTNSSHTKHPCESMSCYVSPCIRELCTNSSLTQHPDESISTWACWVEIQSCTSQWRLEIYMWHTSRLSSLGIGWQSWGRVKRAPPVGSASSWYLLHHGVEISCSPLATVRHPVVGPQTVLWVCVCVCS